MKVKEALHHLSMPKEKKSSKRKVGDQHGHGHQSRTVQSEMSNEKRLIKEFRCTICEIYFSSKDTLKKHNQELHLPIIPSKRPTKLTSNPASISRSSLQFQSSKPPPPGPPGPPVAASISSRHNQLSSVAAALEDEGDFYCEECGTDYSNKQDLKKHMANVHEEEEAISATAKKATGKMNPESFYQDDYEDEDDNDTSGEGELNERSVHNDIIIDGNDEIETLNKRIATKIGKLTNSKETYVY